jgi:hypothetical protein
MGDDQPWLGFLPAGGLGGGQSVFEQGGSPVTLIGDNRGWRCQARERLLLNPLQVTLEDIQHQVQSNCLPLPISLSDRP